MSIFSKLFGSRKLEVPEDIPDTKFDNPEKEGAQDEMPKIEQDFRFPQDIPEAIKFIVDTQGRAFLNTRGLINILNDFQLLKDNKATKNILKGMLDRGYVETILNAQNWQLESLSLKTKFVNEYGTRQDLVSFIFDSFGYGLGYTTMKPVTVINEQAMSPIPPTQTKIPEPPVIEVKPANPDPNNLHPYDPKLDLENYRYPTLNLLDAPFKPYMDMLQANTLKMRVVDVLRAHLKFEISAIKLYQGHTINFFEVTPVPGMKYSILKNAEDDLAMLLSPKGVRVFPIAGTGNVGLEIPRNAPHRLTFREVVDSKRFQESTMDLPCAIGMTTYAGVFMFDLTQLPHLLIGGSTGQGKSICIHSIILSLLYKKHPSELKFVLVDFKRLELGCYRTLVNHFLATSWENQGDPIISNAEQADRVFGALKETYNARFDLIAKSGTRNIKDYNKKFVSRCLNPSDGHKYLPYIVIIVDEYYNLINADRKFLEPIITEIAKKGRTVGIHLIIATNRPTADIVDSSIKTELSGKIAFHVSTSTDSRLILNTGGAEKLIGEGDFMYTDKSNTIVRAQCALPSFDDIDRVCAYISQQQSFLMPYELDLCETIPEPAPVVDMTHLDPLFEDAARLIVREQLGSTSLIQRKFAIGYNRAGRLLDQIEKAGIVGQAHGSKPREVLILDEASLENLLRTLK